MRQRGTIVPTTRSALPLPTRKSAATRALDADIALFGNFFHPVRSGEAMIEGLLARLLAIAANPIESHDKVLHRNHLRHRMLISLFGADIEGWEKYDDWSQDWSQPKSAQPAQSIRIPDGF